MSDESKPTIDPERLKENLGVGKDVQAEAMTLGEEAREVFFETFKSHLKGAGQVAMQAARQHEQASLRKRFDEEIRQVRGKGSWAGKEIRARYRALGLDV